MTSRDPHDDLNMSLTSAEILTTLGDIAGLVRKGIMGYSVRSSLKGMPLQDAINMLKEELFDVDPDCESYGMLDLEVKVGSQIPVGEGYDLLNELKSSREGFDCRSRLSEYGEQQAPVDVIADELLTFGIMHFLDDHISAVAGEEKKRDGWTGLRRAPKGALVVIIDPVDGTTGFRDMRSGFSINVYLYRAAGDGLHGELIGLVIVTETGEKLVCHVPSGRVEWVLESDERHQIDGIFKILRDEHRRGTVAVVASRATSRSEMSGLLDPNASYGLPPRRYGGEMVYDPGLTIYTMGGAPAIAKFIVTELEYIVVPHDQTVYDAGAMVGVLLAAGEGATYYEAQTGAAVSVDQMLDWLSKISGPGTKDARPFKAGLLVRSGANAVTTQRILTALRESLNPVSRVQRAMQQLDNAMKRDLGYSREDFVALSRLAETPVDPTHPAPDEPV